MKLNSTDIGPQAPAAQVFLGQVVTTYILARGTHGYLTRISIARPLIRVVELAELHPVNVGTEVMVATKLMNFRFAYSVDQIKWQELRKSPQLF